MIQCLEILEFRNRLFVLLFKNSDNDPTRSSFDEYYMPVEMKDFFDQPEKKTNKNKKKNLKCQEMIIHQVTY